MQFARRRVQYVVFARKARQQVRHPLPPPPPKQLVRVVQVGAVGAAQKPPNRNAQQFYPPVPLVARVVKRRIRPKPRPKIRRILQPPLQIAAKKRHKPNVKLLKQQQPLCYPVHTAQLKPVERGLLRKPPALPQHAQLENTQIAPKRLPKRRQQVYRVVATVAVARTK